MTRDRIIAAARGWLGTPYHHQGRVKGAGVDCLTLLLEVFEEAGVLPHIETPDYPHDWHFHRGEERYLAGLDRHAHPVATPQPGDVAMFRFGRCASHAAIVVDWPTVIHAYYRQGCVYASADDAELSGRLDSFWSVF